MLRKRQDQNLKDHGESQAQTEYDLRAVHCMCTCTLATTSFTAFGSWAAARDGTWFSAPSLQAARRLGIISRDIRTVGLRSPLAM